MPLIMHIVLTNANLAASMSGYFYALFPYSAISGQTQFRRWHTLGLLKSGCPFPLFTNNRKAVTHHDKI
jgi:hypothetical protein